MTLRLRAHREVVEEYLHSIGQYMPQGGDVAGAIHYDDSDVPSISSALNRDLAAPSSGPPFEVLQSANTLAMLLRVFVEKQQKDEQNKKKDEAIESSPAERPQGSPLRSSSDHPFNQRSTFAQALTPRPTRNNNASPSPNINASFSPTSEVKERTETIDCWIDEGELMLSTEALRRFKSAVGLDKTPQDQSAVLGRRLLLPPELAQRRLSQTKIESSNEVSVAHAADIHAPLDVALTRPPVAIVRQKKSLVGARAVATLPPVVDVPKPLTANKNNIAESEKAQSTPAPPADKQSLSGSPTAAPTAVGEQDSLIADIHRMVKEMRDSATTMKETLAAEAGVMDDAAQLLLDATNKTKTQIRNVEAIGGYTASQNAGLIERLLRKVLPSAVVGMLMHSLSALIALLKTILLVFTIILITGSTLFIIVSRRKPQAVVIYEE